MHAFIDLSTIPAGQEQRRLDAFLAHHPNLQPSNLVVAAPSGSITLPPGSHLVPTDGDPGQKWSSLTTSLQEFFVELNGHQGQVASFQESVQELVNKARADGHMVEHFDLRQLLNSVLPLNEWPENYMTKQEALTFLAKALTGSGGKLRFTQLRPALAALDSRFKKNPENLTPFDRPKFMSSLVAEAERAELVTTSGPSENRYVSLITPSITKELYSGLPNVPLEAPPSNFQRESDHFLHLLRQANLGPFQQVRSTIYDKIDQMLQNESPLKVGILLDNAVANVRNDIENARNNGKEYLIKGGKNLPWSQVRGFIGLLFTRTEVLITPEGPIRGDWLHLDTEVHSAVESWRQILDAELVLHLIQKGCRIDNYTDADLSGALYNQRQDLTEVHALLKYLMGKKICGFAADYSLRII